jgi:hypothetical protein
MKILLSQSFVHQKKHKIKVLYILMFMVFAVTVSTLKSIAADDQVNSTNFIGLIEKKGWVSKKSFLIGSGVIIEKEKIKESRTNQVEKFTYKYTVITNLHVIHPANSREKENASFYFVDINGYKSRATCIHKSPTNKKIDIVILEVLSNKNYTPAIINREPLQYPENGRILGYPQTNTIPELTNIETQIVDIGIDAKSNTPLFNYAPATKTFVGMSGGSILNNSGELIGIHKKEMQGVPISQVLEILNEYKRKPECACSMSFLGDCTY